MVDRALTAFGIFFIGGGLVVRTVELLFHPRYTRHRGAFRRYLMATKVHSLEWGTPQVTRRLPHWAEQIPQLEALLAARDKANSGE